MHYCEIFKISHLRYDYFIDYIFEHYEFNLESCKLLSEYDHTPSLFTRKRTQLLTQVFGVDHIDSNIIGRLFCFNGKNIRIGTHGFINYCPIFLDQSLINIGNNVLIGPHCKILASNDSVVQSVTNSEIQQAHEQLSDLQNLEIAQYLGVKHNLSSLKIKEALLKEDFRVENSEHIFEHSFEDGSVEIQDNV